MGTKNTTNQKTVLAEASKKDGATKSRNHTAVKTTAAIIKTVVQKEKARETRDAEESSSSRLSSSSKGRR